MSAAMRSILSLIAALILFAGPAQAADGAFLKEIDDLPLPPGFVELPGGTLFEAPQGRIVEANAEGTMLEVEARSFYDETLPQLGWARTGADEYRSEKEVLRLEFTINGMEITIHYSVAPAKNAAAKSDDKGAK